MSRVQESKRCMSSWTYNELKAQDEFRMEPCCQRHHPSQWAIKKEAQCVVRSLTSLSTLFPAHVREQLAKNINELETSVNV